MIPPCRRPGRAPATLVAGLLAFLAGSLCPAALPAAQLPYGPALGRAYDAVLDARFDAVEGELQRACPPAPDETCEVVRATALWWRLQVDPHNRSLDAQLQAKVDAAIDAVSAWTRREPRRADAWFFLGAAYGVRVQYRVLRTERLAAARDGKRIKEALERALSLDPGLQDAWFGIGLYHYYAGLAPAALKVLRWLLFLPGGDRAQGLREMLQAADHGELLRGETHFQIHLVYLWYENRFDEGLALLDDLHARYPHNPLFLQAKAEAQDTYLHDHAGSLETWRTMLHLARQGRLSLARMAEARARIGIAEELDALFETDLAPQQLQVVVDARPAAPYGAAARAALGLARCHDRLGSRAEATAAYKLAIALAPPGDPERVRTAASEGLRRPPNPRAAEAYRLSIEGWRALQRGDLASAAEALGRSTSTSPPEAVTRYRVARLLQARHERAAALDAYEQILALRPVAPPTVLAAAYLEDARLREEDGDRPGAIDKYQRGSRVPGADARTRREIQQALARLKGPTH